MRFSLLLAAAAGAALILLAGASGGTFPAANGVVAYGCGADICTVNVDGSGKTTLIHTASDPSWSPDGTQIAFVDPVNGIEVANSDGTGAQQLGSGATATQPTFSADGTLVAYAKAGDLWSILSSGAGGETHLTNTTATDADPSYSPDGSELAFARNDTTAGTGWDIWLLDLTTDTATQLTNAPGDERNPTWSPSGLSIVFQQSTNGHLFFISPFASAGSGTDLNITGTQPAYAPDGSKLAYLDGSGHLVTSTAGIGGGNTSTLDAGAGLSNPDWQPIAAGSPPSVTSGPPVNTSYPTINLTSGDTTPVVGDFLTASVGTWAGSFPIAFTYQWKDCDPNDTVNGQCIDIPGATSSFYTPTPDDYGRRLRVQVTATNSQGKASQNSEVSAVVAALGAVVSTTPQISDTNPVVDTPLSVGDGIWQGSTPITFTYSWRRCNPVGDLDSCVAIDGATTTSYTPTVADIGFSLRVWIVGKNVAGSDTAITNHTFPVVDKPHFAPSVQAQPAIVGTALPGRQLTANIGSFQGDAPITTSFRWYRCNAVGAQCRVLPVTKITYQPTAKDVGFTLKLYVFATNAYGKFTATSDPTETIASEPPHVRGRRIVGTNGADYLAGGGHDDVVIGLGGNDTILGGAGDDRLEGGDGNDVITGGAGADRIFGGAGSDTIYANDGEKDVIDCGAGDDRVVADSFDVVKNCEVVSLATTTPTSPTTP